VAKKPWKNSMPEKQFELMRDIIGAPSPIGLEGSMTYGLLKPHFESFAPKGWKTHQFRGNAGLVLDTHPDDDEMFTVMVIGHADKIRMQVRSIGDDGKIWINSDSFLPTTLIGHEVLLFSENPDEPGQYRTLEGGTIEAIGAIHFADSALRSGDKGIKKEMLYLELQAHGEDRKQQIEELGICPGDPIILNRKIRRGFSSDTFYGAYLDNGLGCFVTSEIARLVANVGGFDNVRCLFTIATHEEIGRMGSRVAAGLFEPDVVIAADVSHDYKAAPGISDRRMTPVEMGKGFSLKSGSIVSEFLNARIETACREADIPYQKVASGRDTGTDAMAAVFAAIDAAATSIGFPIRNMHTISETGHTGDVLSAIHAMFETLKQMDADGLSAADFRDNHPRLDLSSPIRAK
jgi:endoglucanase